MLRTFFRAHHVKHYLLWYYTPMALEFTRHLQPRAVVYDCMDELSAFAGADTEKSKAGVRNQRLVLGIRLATYKYYNMDQVVAQALATYSRIVGLPRRELLGA